MVRVNWTLQAQDDLKSIAYFISKDSVQYARLQIHRIRNQTQILRPQARIGKIIPEMNKNTYRELIEGRFRIIYKIVSENQIDILTIHHSARDLGRRTIE